MRQDEYFKTRESNALLSPVFACAYLVSLPLIGMKTKWVAQQQTVKKEDITVAQKGDQILGIVMICVGVFGYILEPNLGLMLMILDVGITSIILPPLASNRRK
ncbi:hypothetical protein EQ500_04785 [Lactobacillus sp. XV13L]|nr:hypothetical protein [Lactobacillus sp. XV13L]